MWGDWGSSLVSLLKISPLIGRLSDDERESLHLLRCQQHLIEFSNINGTFFTAFVGVPLPIGI